MKRTYLLVILDGWGIGQNDYTNPIYQTQPKTINFIKKNFSSCALQASSIAVGLPWGEAGNSEVGHLTIGAGKVIYQYYPRISIAIEDGSFFENQVLKQTFEHSKKNNSALHIVGLLTEGIVHASLNHLKALVTMTAKQGYKNTYFHLFSDGRDSLPHAFLGLYHDVEDFIKQTGYGQIASICGRYFSMNREENWDRTQKAYDLLTKGGQIINDVDSFVKKHYESGLDDEYLPPAVVNTLHNIKDGDSVIFFNFREDSMRQIVQSFVDPNFNYFPVQKFNDLFITTMTQYSDNFVNAHVAFPPEKIEEPLAKVLSENNKMQLHIAETEKYAHVTYFFNGLIEKPFPNEFRVLIPSKHVPKQDDAPEMMAKEITDRIIAALNDSGFDFIVANYANPDIIAHTGNYEAAVKAINVIDNEISRLLKTVLELNHLMIITADHGNIEVMLDIKTGEPQTKHDPSPVPFYLVANEFKFKKELTDEQIAAIERNPIGVLSDIAPTILHLMGIKVPASMTGQNLLPLISKTNE
ncbi:MAG: 2,3-bisphosphoglycerate-independent phosphoglycerate mutase [Minisyncoccia bacterium]